MSDNFPGQVELVQKRLLQKKRIKMHCSLGLLNISEECDQLRPEHNAYFAENDFTTNFLLEVI